MFARIQEEYTNIQHIVPLKCVKNFPIEDWKSHKKRAEIKLRYFKVKTEKINSAGETITERKFAFVLKIAGKLHNIIYVFSSR